MKVRSVQHLPVLVDEEISLDVLRLMLSSGQLDASLTALGLKLGARFKIEHGLRALSALLVDTGGDDGTGAVVVGGARGSTTDAEGDEGGAGEDAAAASAATTAAAGKDAAAASAATTAAAGEDAAAASAATTAGAASATPQWFLDGFEDIS